MKINPRPTQINYRVLDNFMSIDECDALIDMARSKMEKSTVSDPASGASLPDDVRTSESCFIPRGMTPFISSIEARISEKVGLPVEQGEPMNVLHYSKGGYYRAHYDFFDSRMYDKWNPVFANGGQRILTFMVYLNTVIEGGETHFPKANINIHPLKGCAVYWWNVDADLYQRERETFPDRMTLHEARPVKDGEKWVFTKWFREDVVN